MGRGKARPLTTPADSAEFAGVLETALCYDHDERSAMHAFFEETLRLQRVAGWESGTAYRVGSGVLLIFDREELARSNSPVSAHGTTGPGHVCLRANGGYEELKDRLAADGVEITHEHEWPGGGRSFYFSDPAGNLLEVANGDIWPGR